VTVIREAPPTEETMARSLLATVAAAAVATASAGIYPDDHWQYSTQLTADNFDSTVQEAIDAGKTLFVRWIASEG